MPLTSGTSSVQLLIAAGADVNAKSPQGWTALAKAAYNGETERGYVEVIEVLHGAGASLDDAFSSASPR